MQYIQQLYEKYEYEEVGSPNIYNFELWNTSGHAAHYKDNMFVFQVEKQEFGLKPMNCPGPLLLCMKPHCCIMGGMMCGSLRLRASPWSHQNFLMRRVNKALYLIAGRYIRWRGVNASCGCMTACMSVQGTA